jgi:hypothetical protein
MNKRIDKTGRIYGQLEALYDTGERTKKGECVWAAKCLNVRNGAICGRVIETHKLGQKDGPKQCPECGVAMFCQPRDITGQVFAGRKAVKRIKRYDRTCDIWLFRCLGCGRRVRRNAAKIEGIAPCRKCNPLPKPPQKVTPTDYPALTAQIEFLRAKLAPELSAGKVLEVPVGGGRYSAFVDAQDAPNVLSLRWYVRSDDNDRFYADTKIDGRDVPMHRIILGLTDPKIAGDHRDHIGINNTRSNIRPATSQQNGINTRKRSGHTSRYKGVSWKTVYGRWVVTIELDGKKKHLGYCTDETEAARIYNDAARELFGEFACLNDVPPRKPPVSVGLEYSAVA